MKILIYGLNYSPELTGIGKFTGEMGAWFAAHGHEIRAVVAPPYYPEWAVHGEASAWRYKKELIAGAIVYRCPLYVPKAPRTATRLFHLATFALSSMPVLLKQVRWRPDVILTVIPTLFCTPVALLVGTLSGAKSVLHIQDFEIDAMVGLGLGRRGLVVRAMEFMERALMRRFDAISSISGSMVERVRRKTGHSRLLEFPNWVDTDLISMRQPSSPYRDEWSIGDATKVVLYSGNVGEKQGLEVLLDVAKSFAADTGVLFVIVGAGAGYASLMRRARARGLTNIRFYPLQPHKRMPDLLSLADVHLVIQKRGAADLVMPSKLAAILSAGGHALITADPDTELGRLCLANPGIAYPVEPENAPALSAALRAVLESPRVAARQGNAVARSFAESRLSKDRVLVAMAEQLARL